MQFNERSGATVIGARDLLVAFNVNLEGGDGTVAGAIAADMRKLREEQRRSGVESGPDLRGVKAIGWQLPGGPAQISTNIVDIKLSGPDDVVVAVRQLAQSRGVRAGKCELIGCIPRGVLERAKELKSEVGEDRVLEALLEDTE